MRNYRPAWMEYGITKFRYDELLAYCRQYPEKKAEAASLLGIGGQTLDGMPHGTDVGDPVGRAAERREKLLGDIALIEQCAAQVDGGKWYTALIQNICLRKAYMYLDAEIMPTSNRNDFYRVKKHFFVSLDEKLRG